MTLLWHIIHLYMFPLSMLQTTIELTHKYSHCKRTNTFIHSSFLKQVSIFPQGFKIICCLSLETKLLPIGFYKNTIPVGHGFLIRGDFAPFKGIWQCQEPVLIVTSWGGLLASSWQRPGLLTNILRCTEDSTLQGLSSLKYQ